MAAKVFEELAEKSDSDFVLYSLHDKSNSATEPYIRPEHRKAFGGRKWKFVVDAVRMGRKSRVVVLSHINLALPGLLIKWISSSAKVVLIAHGIEIWARELTWIQKKFIAKADLIIAVSSFTKERLKSLFGADNVEVINNCIDPFLPVPSESRDVVRKSLNVSPEDFVLLSVSRLSFKEVNKNYDKVLMAMQTLKSGYPCLKYVFIGKYEEAEKERLCQLADSLGLKGDLIFTGFVPDADLPSYYHACDLYIMPSKKEGFGITFIEAAYYGMPVIAGNKDGSADALLNGRLGVLVDPDNQDEITEAIREVYNNRGRFRSNRELVIENFGFDMYKKKWENVLERSTNFTPQTT